MILVIRSLWNNSLTDKLVAGAVETLKKHAYEFKVIDVPGSLEIPLAISWAIEKSPKILGFVACGIIIKGETMHFELVSQEASRGLSDLGLKHQIPIGNALIPAYNIEQAIERCGGRVGNKGIEAAEAVVKMLELKKQMKEIL